jgi:hypothetical protein
LFGRGARVTVWRAEPAAFFSQPNATNGLLIENLRIQFEIEHTTEKEPNKCNLTITNAGPETRAFVTTKPIALRLEAGYANEYHHLFVGDLRYGQSKLDGVDWSTTLEIADGDRAYRHARVSESFRAGSTVADVLRKVTTAMQVYLAPEVLNSPELAAPYHAGLVAHGPARDVLSKILTPLGYSWDTTQGQLRLTLDGSPAPGLAYLIDATNGLIGSPETAAPNKPGQTPITTIRTLLDPRLLPHHKIQLQSERLAGVFQILKVRHLGDTHGGDFQTEIEAKPV